MENINFWLQSIISLLSGLLVLIPLVVKLIQYIRIASMEKNWPNLLTLTMNLMTQAELNFEEGIDKKEWVLSEVEALSQSLNYDIDYNVLEEMIDALCKMSKQVNIERGE